MFAFLLTHVVILFVAALATPIASPLYGAMALAQAGLLGVWMGAGNESLWFRVVTGLAAGAHLIAICILRETINPGPFLLGLGQFVTVAVCLSLQHAIAGVVIARPLESLVPYHARLTIRKLLIATVALAALLAAFKALDESNHSFGDELFVLLALFSGGGFAAIPLLGCWAILGQPRLEWLFANALLFFLIALMIGGGMAWFTYSQTDRSQSALDTFVMAAYEAAYLAVTFCYLRGRGFQFVTKRSSSPGADALVSGVRQARSAR